MVQGKDQFFTMLQYYECIGNSSCAVHQSVTLTYHCNSPVPLCYGRSQHCNKTQMQTTQQQQVKQALSAVCSCVKACGFVLPMVKLIFSLFRSFLCFCDKSTSSGFDFSDFVVQLRKTRSCQILYLLGFIADVYTKTFKTPDAFLVIKHSSPITVCGNKG